MNPTYLKRKGATSTIKDRWHTPEPLLGSKTSVMQGAQPKRLRLHFSVAQPWPRDASSKSAMDWKPVPKWRHSLRASIWSIDISALVSIEARSLAASCFTFVILLQQVLCERGQLVDRVPVKPHVLFLNFNVWRKIITHKLLHNHHYVPQLNFLVKSPCSIIFQIKGAELSMVYDGIYHLAIDNYKPTIVMLIYDTTITIYVR